jgi:asparagine synthase (glutamine-hydrolysing)
LSLEGDMLVKVDRSSMLASLECRAPFLNRALWDFTSQLPENFLVNGVNKKFILKEAFREYFPKDFLNKPKKGFGVPVGDWLKSSLRPEVISFVDTKYLINQNIFNVENTQRLIHNHLSGKQDNSFRVWTFYCFQKWYRHIYGR